MRKVNFNLDSTVNYADLQRQMAEFIQVRLREDQWTTSTRRYDPQCLNLTLFIREEGDVFLSHRLADRNYFWTKDATGNRFINRFFAVLVPGRWMKARLLNSSYISLEPDQVFCVGSPRIDLLRRAQERFQRSAGSGRLRVLWAPTHNAQAAGQRPALSSYPNFASSLDSVRAQSDVFALHHPRHRKEKYATVDELVAADVVISDISSVVYEAWSLGKPVIFPRWLLGDQVLARFPFSAEARIYQERIGYHPESVDELVEILRSRPAVGADVHDFMDEYLDNYRGGDASGKISKLLLCLADKGGARSKEHELAAVMDHLLARADAKPDLPPLESTARTSVQLLQLQLLNERYQEFQAGLMTLREFLAPGPGLSKVFDSLVVESAILQSDTDAAAVAIAALGRRHGSSLAGCYKARLAFLTGHYDTAFKKAAASVVDAGTFLAAVPTIVQAARAVGRNGLAWTAQEAFLARHPCAEAVADLSLLVSTPEEWYRYQAILRNCASNSPKLNVDPLTILSTARAASQVGKKIEAKQILRQFALDVAGNKGILANLQASPIQFDPHSSLPRWSLPFESLPSGRIAAPARRAVAALRDAAGAFSSASCPVFLVRQSLIAWCDQNDKLFPHEGVEFGAFGNGIFQDAHRLLTQSPKFVELPSADSEWTVRFKHNNGVKLTVFLHCKVNGEAIHRDSGVVLRTYSFSLARVERDGVSINMPEDPSRYIRELYAEDQWKKKSVLIFENPRLEIVDEDSFAVRAYSELLKGIIDDDPFLIATAIRMLKRVGEKDFDVTYALGGKYFQSAVPSLVEDTRFLLHIGDGPDAEFHIDLWFSYCRNADPALAVVLRSRKLFDLLAEKRPDLPAIYIQSGMQAEWLVNACPKLVGVLYASNTGNTIHFLRFPQLRHIFLGHGDSDKSASCHKFFRAYDEVWTAGQAHVDRFRNSGIDFSNMRFRIVGRPTLRKLMKTRQRHAAGGRFLYLPTWEGFQSDQNYSSIALGQDFLVDVALSTGKAAEVKLHPWTGTQNCKLFGIEEEISARCDSAGVSLRVADKDTPVADLMVDADLLIADISSVVSDFLCTERPIFLFLPKSPLLRMSTSKMSVESYCYVFSDPTELASLVHRAIVDGDDYLRDARSKAARYCVDFERTEQQQFETELRNVIREVADGTGYVGRTESDLSLIQPAWR
jgi:CDP-glycerol glycerophosphotransferase (TagB/SpsB family)